ncbi:MAG: class I SAM-dependent methyltransferase [Verrucomicrobia bacterium]|nr:class I SAM-dependent methyltransferase [Verrucomicrobiota bacterium]
MADGNTAFLARILDALKETETSGLLGDHGLTGISGDKTVGALQRMARLFPVDTDACYLEIGVYQGLTLVSTALAAPEMACFGIDNFSTLDPAGENKKITAERLDKYGATNATLIDADFEDGLASLDAHLQGRRIGVYFIDGPHDYRSQLICLLLAKGYLHDNAVIVIDDANYSDVRFSTRDFLLGHSDFKMIFEAYSPAHPANMTATEKQVHEAGWLNGVNVLVRDPAGVLSDMLPPIDPDTRTVYFNEWLVHRLRRAELAPEAVTLADAICTGDVSAEETARVALLKRQGDGKDISEGRFADRNTHSGGLTEGRFNNFKI